MFISNLFLLLLSFASSLYTSYIRQACVLGSDDDETRSEKEEDFPCVFAWILMTPVFLVLQEVCCVVGEKEVCLCRGSHVYCKWHQLTVNGIVYQTSLPTILVCVAAYNW